jgi:hypothetical protein
MFCKEETPKVLIVEGKNDCHGVYQIAAQKGSTVSLGFGKAKATRKHWNVLVACWLIERGHRPWGSCWTPIAILEAPSAA